MCMLVVIDGRKKFKECRAVLMGPVFYCLLIALHKKNGLDADNSDISAGG